MKGQTKAKLIVFFIVAIIAFAASSMAANIILIKNPNDNTLLAIEDDNFTPQKAVSYTHLDVYKRQKVVQII